MPQTYTVERNFWHRDSRLPKISVSFTTWVRLSLRQVSPTDTLVAPVTDSKYFLFC